MPSPIGHVLGGIATTLALDASASRRSGAGLFTTCAALAAAPDLDLFVRRYHRTATHSVTAVALTFIIAAALTGKVTCVRDAGASAEPGRERRSGAPRRQARWRERWYTATACALAYASHLLLDWLGADTHRPFGLEAFWPFSHRWFISGLDVFRETSRLDLFSWHTTLQNAITGLQEVAILLPIIGVLWMVRERRT
jgi:membrane-bound metal-dependent hydrolase YbcI (DUF457 family)